MTPDPALAIALAHKLETVENPTPELRAKAAYQLRALAAEANRPRDARSWRERAHERTP